MANRLSKIVTRTGDKGTTGLPDGSRAASQCHIARTIAGRAERDMVALSHRGEAPENGLPYLNRLSDLLFVLGRVIHRNAGQGEPLWQRTAAD